MRFFKKVLPALIFVFFGAISSNCQNLLNAQSQVSLITVSPGEELYSTFGHSAIWIFDPQLRIDRVYNYGTFDFNDPNFLPKFVKGKLDYFLSVSDSYNLIYGAQYENRGVIQQQLNLSIEQKNKIFYFLENNALPQSRFYKYEFFYDNCSTRIRDGFKKALSDDLVFHPSTDKTKTFRNLIDEYLSNQKWGDFGIDLLLGTHTDWKARPYEYMFLPDYLMWNFDKAQIKINGKAENLVIKKSILYTPIPKPAANTFYKEPLFIFWSLFGIVLGLTVYQFYTKKYFPFIDIGLFFITGLLGNLFIFAWFFTDHQATVNNYNLIWGMPINILVAFAFMSRSLLGRLKWYFIVYAAMLVLLILCWPFLPQELNTAFIPIILTMVLRATYLGMTNKR